MFSALDPIDSSSSSKEVPCPRVTLIERVNKVPGIDMPMPLLDVEGGIGGSLEDKLATVTECPIENPIE